MRRQHNPDDLPSADRWMVSWADFTTLLFALFVVLYASSSVNHEKSLRMSLALGQAFGAPAPVTPVSGPTAPLKPVQNQQVLQTKKMVVDIRNALNLLLTGGQLNVTQSGRGIGIDINASLLFAPGEATLSDSSVQVTAAVAAVLARYPYQIQVEGHTDNLPIHNAQFASNWELSSARASSVVRRLIEMGVTQERLTVIGHGANHALDANATPAGRARNRRVHVLIVTAEL